MGDPAKTSKFRLLGQVAAVALLSSAAAGCSSDVSRFGNLFETTDNRSQIVQGDPVATGSLAPAPTMPVASSTLPPPAAPVASAPMQPAAVAVAPAAAQPMRPAPALTAAAGETYVVQPGDSLGRIANDRGLRSMELASFNGIDPAAPIKVGQKLRIPDGARPAPTRVASLETKTVTDGTLGTMPAQPTVQTPVTLPAPGTPVVTTPAPAAVPVATAPAAQPAVAPAAQTQVAAVQPQATTGTGVGGSASGNFRWPVRGRVVSGYGVKASGERNDGINIEVPEGTPIKAAEGGTVIYAGNELKGYGNLVLIKHPNGYVSAYAHASEILVKRDDVIMRGQTIGKVGATGNVPRPQLHFEIRKGNKPVDPIPYLAG